MITWWQLLIPGVTTITNRLWRGEGEVSRPTWYAFMFLLFLICDFPLIHVFGVAYWMLFVAGYAMLPWQAEYSIATGREPDRKDHWSVQWMQTLAYKLAGRQPLNFVMPEYWHRFGIIYGHIRGLCMMPGVLLLAWYYSSIVPLTGLAIAIGFPWVMVAGCKLRDHFGLAEDKAIIFEQLIMGWLLGTYLLICRSAL